MPPQICPNCSKEIPEAAIYCEFCKFAIQPANPDAQPKGKYSATVNADLFFAIASIFLIVAGILPGCVDDFIAIVPYLILAAFILAFVGALTSFATFLWFIIRKKSIKKTTILEGWLLNVTILILMLIILPALTHRGERRPISCVNNLKILGLVMGMYSSENAGKFPPIDDTKNNFIFDANTVFPEYLTDAKIVACPEDAGYSPRRNFRLVSTMAHPGSSPGDVHPDCITDMSYCYLGWLVTNDEEAGAFFEAYDRLSPEAYDKDIVVPAGRGNCSGNILHRLIGESMDVGLDYEHLCEIAKIYSNKDISQIPVMWDKPSLDPSKFSHHDPILGGNVLYLDGHVEFIEYPGKFPMTETMARLLDERPRAPIPDCD